MPDMPNVIDQDCEEPQTKAGSVLFCRLPPTNRITEAITFAFYPLFFGIVTSALISGFAGHIVGAGLGAVLAIIAITFRRWGARWGEAHTKERERQEGGPEDKEQIAVPPHHNFILLSEIFYMSLEVIVIGFVSATIILISFNSSVSNFVEFYNNYIKLIDTIFIYYHGLDNEIKTHVGTIYEGRILFIKSSSTMVVASVLYGNIIMFLRLLLGWKRYWLYLSRVSSRIQIKIEKYALLTLTVFPLLWYASIDVFLNEGIEYYLILEKIPADTTYQFFALLRFVFSSEGFVIFLFLQLAILLSYGCLLLFLLSKKISSKRKLGFS